jgi:hypothetical protein
MQPNVAKNERWKKIPKWQMNGILSTTDRTQGCKLLSDIGQCPTKFGKCPSKSNFDRTLVRSQKKLSHTFFSLRRNGYIQTCLVTYIYLATYICPTN